MFAKTAIKKIGKKYVLTQNNEHLLSYSSEAQDFKLYLNELKITVQHSPTEVADPLET